MHYSKPLHYCHSVTSWQFPMGPKTVIFLNHQDLIVFIYHHPTHSDHMVSIGRNLRRDFEIAHTMP